MVACCFTLSCLLAAGCPFSQILTHNRRRYLPVGAGRAVCKSAVVVRILQVGLLAGALLVWAKSGFEYVAMRQAMDAPWLRLAFIMGGVTLFTLLCAWSGNGLAKNRSRLP